jgi:hypothetical protein
MQEVCKILWTDVQLPLPWAIKAVSGWFTRHMKMSRYTKAGNKDSKFKKFLFDADAPARNAAAGNKPKNKKTSPADVSKKEIVYGHSSVAERNKFHQSVLTSPRVVSTISPRVVSTISPSMSSVLTSPRVSQKHDTITTSFIAGDHVIIGPDQTTMYARASIGTLSILFSIVFIVLTDYCLRRCWYKIQTRRK